MASFRITCKSWDPTLKRITHVGIEGINGRLFTEDQIVHWIHRRIHTFYTLEEGHMATVIPKPIWWGYYLSTSPDGVLEDNLGYLPECQ